jgi:hypothetical protein
MNRQKALNILGLREDAFTEDQLKKEYRSKILEYHPDKNKSPDAAERFIEIQSAYSFLKDSDSDEYRGESYNDLLKKFMSTVFREESPLVAKIVEMICKKICLIVEHNSDHIIEYLRNINRDTLTTIYSVLSKYRGIFHLSSDIFEKIEEILRVDSNNIELTVDEYIVLNPTLENLMSEENIYILKYLDRSYLVPLWQHEMVFDVSGQNLFVKNFPILPENMELDECNVLTVRLQYTLQELWGREVEVEIGGKQFKIGGNMLRMVGDPQQIEYSREGIPYNNMDDVLDTSQKQSIIFIVTVVNDLT